MLELRPQLVPGRGFGSLSSMYEDEYSISFCDLDKRKSLSQGDSKRYRTARTPENIYRFRGMRLLSYIY